MRNGRSQYLSLLMALLAAMTLSLPARARVCGGIPSAPVPRPSAPGHTGFNSSSLPVPAQTPLCHLRCRGFVASVPDAPPQQQLGAPAALEVIAANPLPTATEVALHQVALFRPGSSPPLITVLRL